ncbi:MAG TPA: SGNH/GDSL hydrolase family protein [Pedococcus sp.]|nr:SGNH/GDSL hydrolase family protein [Pedococcus sp.]
MNRARLTLLLIATLVVGACGAAGDTAASASGGASRGTTTTTTAAGLTLVVIGDSIPYNSPDDCPGCRGFVKQYAAALSARTGKPVTTRNLSQHTGLTLPGLMDELDSFKADLSKADAIIVGIAHNSFPLNADQPCGSSMDQATTTIKDWSKVGPACSAAADRTYRPMYDRLFSTVAGWRTGKPTILLALDKYDDWVGWAPAHLTRPQQAKVVKLHDAWNSMLCGSATRHGFRCADVYHAFNGADGTRPSGTLLADDYTHPSQTGNDTIARVLTGLGFAPLA